MNCERCQTELEDFLYGELSERLSIEIRSHLAGCADCAELRQQLERESELFAQFYEQTAIDPSAEMWQAIRSRIETEPAPVAPEEKAAWWQSIANLLIAPAIMRQAALALLLVAVSVTATVIFMKRSTKSSVENRDSVQLTAVSTVTPTPTSDVNSAAVPTPPKENLAVKTTKTNPAISAVAGQPRPVQAKPLSDQELLARQMTRAEREYQGAIKLLEQAIAKRRDTIDPEVFKKYENSLALIDNSILQSRRALRDMPNDLAAGQFLLSAYARKVELMQDIAMR